MRLLFEVVTVAILCVDSYQRLLNLQYSNRVRMLHFGKSWVEELNGQVAIDGVDLAYFKDNYNIRGVIATRNIDNSKPIVVVNADSAIETNNNRPPTPFPGFVSQSIWEKSLWYQRLAFKLLYEKYVITGGSKELWLKQFPHAFDTPIHWHVDEIEKLEYDSLAKKITKQSKDWKLFYENWLISLDGKFKNLIDYEKYIWALECVNSRAFSGSYEGSSAKERTSILLFTGLLAVLLPISQLGSIEQSLTAGFVVSFSVFMRDFIFSKSAGLKRYVMCPFIDMFNHKSDCVSDVSYNYFKNQFELIVNPYQVGDQVFISYGKQSNDRLLQYYGFVEPNNPYDQYDFGLNLVDYVVKHAKEFKFVNPLATIPSTVDRLQIISIALTNTPVDSTANSDTIDIQSTNSNRMASSSLSANDVHMRLYRKKRSLNPGIVGQFDDTTVRALRALYCDPTEWEGLFGSANALGDNLDAIRLDQCGQTLSPSTEASIESALRQIVQIEISNKGSLEADLTLINQVNDSQKENLCLQFRIEKKKLLNEVLELK